MNGRGQEVNLGVKDDEKEYSHQAKSDELRARPELHAGGIQLAIVHAARKISWSRTNRRVTILLWMLYACLGSLIRRWQLLESQATVSKQHPGTWCKFQTETE